jgi:hypothetical protein
MLARREAYQVFHACKVGKKLTQDESRKISEAERHFSNSLHSLQSALTRCRIKHGGSLKL